MNESWNRAWLREIGNSLNSLILALSKVADSARFSLKEDDRWRLLGQHVGDLSQRILPVVTLMGPSGAGKSTIFRMITGVQVPAGFERRPMTRHSVVAVPEDVSERELQLLFPGSQMTELTQVEDLKLGSHSDQVLFYVRQDKENAFLGGDFILADVPDFSTTSLENWEKAGEMLTRAEVVLFVVYRSAYSDQQTLRYLAKAASMAGHLGVMVTMVDAHGAVDIWNDLLENKTKQFRKEHFQDVDFSFRRADGKTAAEFLKEADAWYSPESTGATDPPALSKIHPIEAGAANAPSQKLPFLDFLKGRNLAELMISKRANDLIGGIRLAQEVLDQHEKVEKETERQIELLLKDLEQLNIVKDQLPIGEILNEVLHQSKFMMKWWQSGPLKVIGWVNTGIHKGLESVKNLKSLITSNDAESVSRPTVEREALREVIRQLESQWRAEFKGDVRWANARWQEVEKEFETQEVIKPGVTWNEMAAKRAAEWVKENPKKAALLTHYGGAISLLAGGAVTLDVLGSGGLITLAASKAAATAAVSGGITALLTPIFNRMVQSLHMKNLILGFQDDWKKQRNRELRDFLRECYLKPLILNDLEVDLKRLKDSPTSELRDLVQHLETQIKQLTQRVAT